MSIFNKLFISTMILGSFLATSYADFYCPQELTQQKNGTFCGKIKDKNACTKEQFLPKTLLQLKQVTIRSYGILCDYTSNPAQHKRLTYLAFNVKAKPLHSDKFRSIPNGKDYLVCEHSDTPQDCAMID